MQLCQGNMHCPIFQDLKGTQTVHGKGMIQSQTKSSGPLRSLPTPIPEILPLANTRLAQVKGLWNPERGASPTCGPFYTLLGLTINCLCWSLFRGFLVCPAWLIEVCPPLHPHPHLRPQLLWSMGTPMGSMPVHSCSSLFLSLPRPQGPAL